VLAEIEPDLLLLLGDPQRDDEVGELMSTHDPQNENAATKIRAPQCTRNVVA
jgi:hypothetical protein